MTTRPAIFDTTALTVAGDTDYDAEGDAYDGSALKVEPAAGLIAQGMMRPDKQVPAQHYNWLMNQFAQVMSALISDDDEVHARLDTDETELANHEGRVTNLESWVTGYAPRIKIREFLTSGTLTIPSRVRAALAFGIGGGGGGGGGANGVNAVNKWIAGGGGGGGAIPSMQPLGMSGTPLIPGSTINIDIGPGGNGGIPGAWGTDGGDSVVRYGSEVLALFPGAGAGWGASGDHLFVDWVHHVLGGLSRRGTPVLTIGPTGRGIRWWASSAYDISPYGFDGGLLGPFGGPQSLLLALQPAQGGVGTGGSLNLASSQGAPNPVSGFLGGNGAGQAGDGAPVDVGGPGDTTKRGGGSGGGGGGGGFGPGGNGGPGGWGQCVSIGGPAPSNGDAAAANSGAGGGGGGSGGCEGAGGNGGNGGSGRVYVVTVEEAT